MYKENSFCSGRASPNVAATSRERRPGVNYDVVRTFSAVYKTVCCVVYLCQISENLVKCKTFKTSRKLLVFAIKPAFLRKVLNLIKCLMGAVCIYAN